MVGSETEKIFSFDLLSVATVFYNIQHKALKLFTDPPDSYFSLCPNEGDQDEDLGFITVSFLRQYSC